VVRYGRKDFDLKVARSLSTKGDVSVTAKFVSPTENDKGKPTSLKKIDKEVNQTRPEFTFGIIGPHVQ